MPTILVTGGTGYIGSHTAVELIAEGFDVVIIDNLCNSSIETLDGIETITGKRPRFEQFDLCDRQKVIEFFRNYSIDAIIHFAALKAVGESVNKPLEYYHNNMESLINLLSAMHQFNITSFVFSSSCTVYGQPDKLPVTEDSPIKEALAPYGNTKQISEEIIRDTIHAIPSIQAVLLRYFNPVGAHKSALIGELPLGVPQNLVPFVTQTAAGIREKLRVFGNDYNTPDGTAIRDYIYICDLAKAHVKALRRLLEKKNKTSCEIFNLGTGKGTSVMEIIKAFEKVTGLKLNYELVNRREGDIERVWADTSYANQELGWKSITSLEETLLTAWEWEKRIRNINS
jgi:UDP-glucose 4-epimerase